MTSITHIKIAKPAPKSGNGSPPRLRLALKTAEDVRKEIGRIYREGKAGTREVADVSRLANVLQILVRVIEGSDLEGRIKRLEDNNDGNA